ncbi:MAG: thermonuclease family protein [Methanothrix sp.]|nr:thermonuclease family protein [Methanothrix sp.]
MAFTLIRGTFHVAGYSPDGDSIRFKAQDPSLWKKLSGPAAALNARGHAQLRIEAVDALETHYQGYCQPQRLAQAATDCLLSSLGIDDVTWDESHSQVLSAQDGTVGYILCRSTESNRRPVAFVFVGVADEKDGSEIVLDVPRLKESLNFLLLARGLAYPMYYNGLFSDLRLPLTQAVKDARKERLGLWPCDRTTKGFSVSDLKTITDEAAILPKLFRRIVNYMGEGGSIIGFKEHLQKSCEPLVRIEQVHFSRLDALVQMRGEKVRMAEVPENLIFMDKVLCKKS